MEGVSEQNQEQIKKERALQKQLKKQKKILKNYLEKDEM